MNFSFVLPTLGKKELVLKFLDSLERTTKYKKEIEVLFAIDEGKTAIIKEVQNKKYSFNIRFFECKRSKDFTNDYYNFLSTRSCGNNIIAFNDDAWMRTQDWDSKIIRTIKEYGWSVYMLDIPDTARIKYGNPFPCFPCVSRRAMNTLGWLLCKDVPMYPADGITHQVYHNAYRVIPIRDVLVEHEHIPESAGTKKRMMKIFEDSKASLDGINIVGYIERIKQVACTERKKLSKTRRIFNILLEK